MSFTINAVGNPYAVAAAPGAGRITGPMPAWGGGVPMQGAAQGVAGGMMPQAGGAGSVIKKVLIGGVAGAGVGAAIGLIPAAVPFLGALTVPMGALIGGVGGAVMGLIKGLRDRNKERAMLGLGGSPGAVQPGAGLSPVNTAGMGGAPMAGILGKGATGSKVKFTQRALKRLGLYAGPINGKMDARTAASVRRYEVMKGAVPTGASTPEIRAALSQDSRMIRQFG